MLPPPPPPVPPQLYSTLTQACKMKEEVFVDGAIGLLHQKKKASFHPLHTGVGIEKVCSAVLQGWTKHKPAEGWEPGDP